MDRDRGAYRGVMTALRRPKETDAEKAARRQAIQEGMREATAVPLDVKRACQQALAGAVVVARNAYKIAASDVGMGIELVAVALRGCAMTIDGNLAGMADAAYVERAGTERRQLEADGLADAERARALLSADGP